MIQAIWQIIPELPSGGPAGQAVALRHVMPSYYLIYDNQCPLCRHSVERVRRLDRLSLAELVPLSEAFERLSALSLQLPSHLELHKAIHLYSSDGRVWKGAEAVGQLASLFPKSRWLGRLILLPGVRRVARWVYRIIAANRNRLPEI